MDYNHRNFITKTKSDLKVKEELLDIFYTDRSPKPPWQPTDRLLPYNDTHRIVLDIETSGLDPERDRILAIGCMDASGNSKNFMELDEFQLIEKFISFFRASSPQILLTYNGTNFDLPFLIKRCLSLKIKHPFRKGRKSRRIPSAQVFGSPLEIQEIYISGCDHVDVYICVLRWDNVARQITSHTLKNAVLQMGLRRDRRLELNHQQIQEFWAQGENSSGWQAIQEYLEYDLADTFLLSEKLVPSYWYESLIVPSMSLQELIVAGNATKWQRVLERQYPGFKPKADPKLHFDGGLVISVPGLYRNIAKIDVSSLYPSIMLKYGICSRKDSGRRALSILEYLTRERLKLKAAGKQGDIAAKQQEGALKVLINSLFGFYGTGGVGFNDMEAGALVTAYGRRILQHMIGIIELAGGIQIESDTDGVFFSHPQPESVFDAIASQLPEGINVELEIQARAMFVPAKGAKNYILWHRDGTATPKGIWRKRDRSVLEKEFPFKYLSAFIEEPEKAEKYYLELIKTIKNGELLPENIAITRKIKTGEKKLLTLGNTGDVVTYYHGINGITNTQPYSVTYYINLIDKKRREIIEIAAPGLLEPHVQLKLF